MNVDTEVAPRPALRGPSAGAVTLTVNHKPRLLRIEPRMPAGRVAGASRAHRVEEGM